ncbi:uncharacterized protein LOC132758871 [Ruditapes philippinarum]|uniref:uncharacterized protein LOC132758871 n=1 Tax=Ruditapes philippinarum TaxID=129788 RepID=UPI00295B8830|nr:uncharacterized protein LOC132758871 [Ruditapes philippinarum]
MMQIIRILLPFCLLYCAESASFFKYQSGSVKLGTRLTRDLSERQLHLTIEDRRETLSIKKQLLPGISKRPSRRNADMDLYATLSKDTVCTNELFNGEYSLRCLKQSTNGYSYITSKRAVYVENDESLNVPSVDQLLKIREAINRKTGAEAGEHSRKRRQTTMSKGKQSLITPTISSDTAFIKIRMMMDVAFFNRFLDFVGGDIDEAKSEIECFLTLVINQAALYYASLKDLGAVISSSDGQQYNVDFLPYLEGITFPPQNQDGSFYDIPPLVNNREGRFLITKIFDSGENNISFDVDGLVIDFGEYQSANFPGQQPFNLIHFMSGDYFTFDIYNRISNDSNDDIFVTRIVFGGVSYIGSLCGNFESGNFDGRNGFSSLNSAGIGRLVAHEIGHNIGCFHDTSERCLPEKVTLMSTVYAPPTAAAGEDYYKWSECSGEEIENRFAL